MRGLNNKYAFALLAIVLLKACIVKGSHTTVIKKRNFKAEKKKGFFFGPFCSHYYEQKKCAVLAVWKQKGKWFLCLAHIMETLQKVTETINNHNRIPNYRCIF